MISDHPDEDDTPAPSQEQTVQNIIEGLSALLEPKPEECENECI